jgi:hypothetical protein
LPLSDPFAAPASDAAPPTVDGSAGELDVHVYIVATGMLVIGTLGVGFGIMALCIAVIFAVVQPPPEPGDPPALVMAGIILVESAFAFFPGLGYLAAGIGLLRRSSVAWIGALVGYGIFMGGCCMPFAAYAFWALLRQPIRKVYGYG